VPQYHRWPLIDTSTNIIGPVTSFDNWSSQSSPSFLGSGLWALHVFHRFLGVLAYFRPQQAPSKLPMGMHNITGPAHLSYKSPGWDRVAFADVTSDICLLLRVFYWYRMRSGFLAGNCKAVDLFCILGAFLAASSVSCSRNGTIYAYLESDMRRTGVVMIDFLLLK